MLYLIVANLSVVAVLVVGVGVYIVVHLWVMERCERKWRVLEAKYEPTIVASLNGNDPCEHLQSLRGATTRDREWLVRLLCDYGRWVKGEAAANFVAMMDALGLTEEQVHLLRDGRWWLRARAAWRLGLVRHRRSRDDLIRLLADPHPFVRLTSAVALARLGDRAAIPHLIRHLGHGPGAQPLFLKAVLERFGEGALPELRAMLESDEPVLGRLAVDMLGRLADVHSAEALTAALDSPDKETRIKAAKALRRVGSEEACVRLLALLDDESWELRAMAIRTLGDLGYPPAVPHIAEALADDHFTVREMAGRALRALGPQGWAALAARRDIPDRYARDVVEQMLATIRV